MDLKGAIQLRIGLRLSPYCADGINVGLKERANDTARHTRQREMEFRVVRREALARLSFVVIAADDPWPALQAERSSKEQLRPVTRNLGLLRGL